MNRLGYEKAWHMVIEQRHRSLGGNHIESYVWVRLTDPGAKTNKVSVERCSSGDRLSRICVTLENDEILFSSPQK